MYMCVCVSIFVAGLYMCMCIGVELNNYINSVFKENILYIKDGVLVVIKGLD